MRNNKDDEMFIVTDYASQTSFMSLQVDFFCECSTFRSKKEKKGMRWKTVKNKVKH